ncbi:MAG TPA: metal ABC transporter ATP-binding protein [Chloroflexota bacterium]
MEAREVVAAPGRARTVRERGAFTLVCEGVTVRYGRVVALADVGFEASAGEVVGVVGPNGAGKTTLFRALVGLVPLERGAVLLDGEPVRGARSRVVYVPQREAVDWSFPISVLDVVLMGVTARRGWLHRATARDREAAMAALEEVDMAAYADFAIGDLSGGQQQRVFLARALCQGGDVLALDEPFAALDVAATRAVEEILRRLVDRGRLVLLSTHDLSQAAQLCDRVLLLNRRPVAYGPPTDVLRPETLRAAYGHRVLVVGEGRVAVSDLH